MFRRVFGMFRHEDDNGTSDALKSEAMESIQFLRQQRYYALTEARKVRIARKTIEATGNFFADAAADRRPNHDRAYR